MPRYISLLRAINVSGQKKILMVDLKSLYEDLGFTNVQTYIQSGNVVFESNEENKEELQLLIFNKIKAQYGFDVPNLLLSPREIKEVLTNNPYQSIEKMYFVFLSEVPSQKNKEELCALTFDNEFYEIKQKVIYFHCPDGYGNAKLNTNFFEKKLNVIAT